MALEKIRPRVVDETGNYTFNNVTATGNLVTLNANLGNVAVANYVKTDNLLYSNGSPWSFGGAVTASGSNTQVQFNNAGSLGSSANFVFDRSTNRLTVDNITANGAALTNLSGANVTGTVGNANYAAYAGNITLAAQSNITSLGTLGSLTVTGDIASGNANLGNFVIANFFSGSGNNLSNIQASNVTGAVSYATTANSVAGANVSGAVAYAATANAVAGANVLGEVSFAATANSVAGANVSGFVANANVANTAFAVAGANVSGQVSNALIAGTVYTNAQPNITSVGTLSSLVVTGNISSGNANLGNAVTANYFVGSGIYVTGVAAATAATVTTNAQPNITSVGTLTSLIIGNATANTTFGNGTITATGNISFTGANVSLGDISNLKITGGTAGYFVTTDGAGNLSWGAAAGGGGVSATGSNTQLQFNDGGVLGASANLVFDKTTNTFTTGRVVASAGANLGTNVANVYIGGGSANQILKTDGSGNLTWIAQPVATMTVDNFTGDGTTTAFTLSTAPTNINFTVVNYNGAFQLREAYSISGTTITFTEAPNNGSKVEVTTTSGATSGAGAFVTRTYTGNGVATTYTVTSGVTVSSVIVTENGLVQTPTVDYTISGTTLTFVAAPANGITIQIRELAIAIVTSSGSALTIKDEGSNLTTVAASIDFVGGGVTATNTGNAVTVTIPSGSNNARTTGYSLVFGG